MSRPKRKDDAGRYIQWPVWPDKLEAALRALSPDVAGYYAILLCWMWNNGDGQCSVSASKPVIMRLLGMTQKRYQRFINEVAKGAHPILRVEGEGESQVLVSNGQRKEVARLDALYKDGKRGTYGTLKGTPMGTGKVHLKSTAVAEAGAIAIDRSTAVPKRPRGDRHDPVRIGDIPITQEQSGPSTPLSRALAYEPDPTGKQRIWQPKLDALAKLPGGLDWFEARLNEADDRTQGRWQHKYTSALEGNVAAWLMGQVRDYLKGVWK